ncbi:MAG TPA: FUSC family membrane protein [Rhizomicrobium sp.]|nr:FUSC family membrane protein [Rhizomicrobium sp.]
MPNISRTAALAMFRVHIENGLTVAAGIGLTGLLAGWILGFDAAIAAATGAVCISISDQPDPLRLKPWILGWALVIAIAFTALTAFAQFWWPPYGLVALVIFTGLWTGLISAYGKRGLILSMTGVLTFVYAMGRHFPEAGDAVFYLELFAAGALFYALYSGIAALLLDDRVRRLLLGEAMRGFATYLRAKAVLYNPDMEGPAVFRGLIDAHAALIDRLQAARDAIFSRRNHVIQKKRIDSLIALLDAFETMLSSDADFELLKRSERRDLKWRIHDFILLIADEVERLTLALRSRHARVAPRLHKSEDHELVGTISDANREHPEEEAIDHAFFVTANKLVLAESHVAALAKTLDWETPPSTLSSELDLNLFQQSGPRGLAVLAQQFDLDKPALRFAIRLSLAMLTGTLITLAFPRFAHANWILLTIALIMRANFSITRRRRWDRITGTLIGCAVAVVLIALAPPALLLTAIVLAIGLSHAYAGVRYRITAVGASISSLLLLHFSQPMVHPQFLERVADTLIGAGLSYVFSFLLPHWERNDLPRLIKALLAADRNFAEAALRRVHARQPYRLARKKTLDAVALLSQTIRRLADEPNTNRRTLASLNELLGANYAFASDLASMPILMKTRGTELHPDRADAQISATRAAVTELLAKGPGTESAASAVAQDSQENFAMIVLARRLAHIELSARKVARLAARPVIAHENEHAH